MLQCFVFGVWGDDSGRMRVSVSVIAVCMRAVAGVCFRLCSTYKLKFTIRSPCFHHRCCVSDRETHGPTMMIDCCLSNCFDWRHRLARHHHRRYHQSVLDKCDCRLDCDCFGHHSHRRHVDHCALLTMKTSAGHWSGRTGDVAIVDWSVARCALRVADWTILTNGSSLCCVRSRGVAYICVLSIFLQSN